MRGGGEATDRLWWRLFRVETQACMREREEEEEEEKRSHADFLIGEK